jgi:long-chain acyl-CoA synthetase
MCRVKFAFLVFIVIQLGHDVAEFVIGQAQIKAVVCDYSKVKSLLDIATRVNTLIAIIVMPIQSFDTVAPPDRIIASGTKSGNATVYKFSDVEALGAQNKTEHHPPTPETLCTICYTSGTTGNPKVCSDIIELQLKNSLFNADIAY